MQSPGRPPALVRACLRNFWLGTRSAWLTEPPARSHGENREPAFGPRIVAVLGDLALPQMGLSDADFSRLAHTVQVIYHNGALVRRAGREGWGGLGWG